MDMRHKIMLVAAIVLFVSALSYVGYKTYYAPKPVQIVMTQQEQSVKKAIVATAENIPSVFESILNSLDRILATAASGVALYVGIANARKLNTTRRKKTS
jgi:ABC-type nitrate/sulfonate/bicarbonate transport system permease component